MRKPFEAVRHSDSHSKTAQTGMAEFKHLFVVINYYVLRKASILVLEGGFYSETSHCRCVKDVRANWQLTKNIFVSVVAMCISPLVARIHI